MRHHICDEDEDIFDPCEDPCAKPLDPCETRWRREAAYKRRTRRESGTIVLIAVLIAVAAVSTFALFATGVLVWNSVEDDRVVGVPATGGGAAPAPDNNDNGGKNGDVTINTDKIGITTDKIIVDKNKHGDKDKHNDD